jgi:CBS domain-containing protein
MPPETLSVRADEDQERAARLLQEADLPALPVVDKSLDEMLTAADDAGGRSLDDLLEDEKPTGSLDDLLSRQPKKPTWPGES